MKETVTTTKHPWLVGICVVVVTAAYFVLLANSHHPEPGPNLLYDTAEFEQADQVESRFEETGRLTPTVEAPKALAAGPDGTLYVAGKDCVQVLDSSGAEVKRFEVKGSPTCMTLTPERVLLLGIRNRVASLSVDDSSVTEWPELDARAYITSIAVHGEDVYVGDAGNRVVLHFGRDGSLKGRIGETDPQRDIPGLLAPSPYLDVAVNTEGTLWVANPGRLGLESYRENGDLITSWYKPSMKLEGFSGCCNPAHIAFRDDGKLVTCEKGLVRVKIYDVTSGTYEELVAGSSLFPRAQSVRDLAVDARGRILVLDPKYNAVRVFEHKDDENDRPHQPA